MVEIEVEPKPVGIKCNGQTVVSVAAKSQAEQQGVKVGWKVVTIGGKSVTTTADITKALAAFKKSGKRYTIQLDSPSQHDHETAAKGWSQSNLAGTVTLTVEPKPFGIKCNGKTVTIVAPGSQAERKGVIPGWKILQISGRNVQNTSEITKALAESKKRGKTYTIICRPNIIVGGAATSTKCATHGGHKVVTIVEGVVATAAAPLEPCPIATEKKTESNRPSLSPAEVGQSEADETLNKIEEGAGTTTRTSHHA